MPRSSTTGQCGMRPPAVTVDQGIVLQKQLAFLLRRAGALTRLIVEQRANDALAATKQDTPAIAIGVDQPSDALSADGHECRTQCVLIGVLGEAEFPKNMEVIWTGVLSMRSATCLTS